MHENVYQCVELDSDVCGKHIQSNPAIEGPGLACAFLFVHEPKLADGDPQSQ